VKQLELKINGKQHTLEVDPARSLLEVLRDELGLLGTKYGCGEGQCGACTVLVDGAATRSCVLSAGAAAGKALRTVEGLADGDRLHPLQQAFLDCGALQCGYCTAGMLMSACALLERTKEPSEAEIRQGLQGNLCRCGTYRRIVRAVGGAAQALRKAGAR
jgi:aerobic-type carbon monoxide dehydrogenase small subunit (CoxS/CutS family)